MPRSKGIVIENNFIGGLNTEATALTFPTNAATDAENCIFDETGRIFRRPEYDLEEGYVIPPSTGHTTNGVFTEYLWEAAGGTGLINLLVQQDCQTMRFYNVSESNVVTPNQIGGSSTPITFSLDSFTITDGAKSPRYEMNQYCTINGDLIIVNPACDPIRVVVNPDTYALTTSRISIKYRDFLGVVADPYTGRPSFSDINTMKVHATGSMHFYNLLNQGWWQGGISGGNPDSNSALGQWDTARTDMPSNYDYVAYFRASATDAFDNARVNNQEQGNTPAPKGHYILTLGNADRRQAVEDEGYTFTYSSVTASLLSGATGTTIGNYTQRIIDNTISSDTTEATVFDGMSNRAAFDDTSSDTLNRFVGKDYGGTPRAIYRAVVYPYNYSPFLTFGYGGGAIFYATTITMQLRGHSSAPSTGTEGTLLATTSFAVSNATGAVTKTLESTDKTTTFRYVWIYMSVNSPGSVFVRSFLADIQFYEAITNSGTGTFTSTDVTNERPSVVASYAGRVWYGGVNTSGLSNNLYFSQIVDIPSRLGSCHQLNDPTAEDINQILPSDGGVLTIPDMGKVIRLWPQQAALIVFATNGVWLISGSGQGVTFTATDFLVRRLSSIGTQSPLSFVDVQGFPYWWGEDGIYRLNYNPQFDSFSVERVSLAKIQTFFEENVAPGILVYVKGAYNPQDDIIHWLYRVDPEAGMPNFNYNRELRYNTRSEAFYYNTIGENGVCQIKGIAWVRDSIGVGVGKIKYTTQLFIDNVTKYLVYSACTDKTTKQYIDWYKYGAEIGNSSHQIDYSSYFITGYRLDAETMRFFQGNYVMLFLENEENSGAYLQGVFDFATTSQGGDWSVRQETSKQQVFNNDPVYRDISMRRLKIRGRGRSLQLRVTSQTGKPFTIIGWSILETGNADL